jgi:short subunit dehydrogenase-like uncharacterized protein
VRFADRARYVASAPWGDLVPAHDATGIPSVTVYLAMPRALALWLRATGPMCKLLAIGWVRRVIERLAARFTARVEPRADGWLTWWGEVRRGEARVAATITVPDPYAFTIDSTIAAVQRVLAGEIVHGANPPARAFGDDFALTLPGVAFARIADPLASAA